MRTRNLVLAMIAYLEQVGTLLLITYQKNISLESGKSSGINHGDCADEIERLKRMRKARAKLKEVR